jgi:site-specific DNA-methyltransferase (cytosine-N4-specific)
MENKFPYGKEFTAGVIKLSEIMTMISKAEGSVADLKKMIQDKYWTSRSRTPQNRRTLAMNTFLTIRSYGLVVDVEENKEKYETSELFREILNLKNQNERHFRFASFLLLQRHGYTLLKVIQSIIDQGHEPSLESINEGLTKVGLYVSRSAGYVSTMKSWLFLGGVISDQGYSIDWIAANNLMGLKDPTLVGIISHLDKPQMSFLKAVLVLATDAFVPVTRIAEFCLTTLGTQLPSKSLSTEIVMPLQIQRLIEVKRATTGRGAKPHEIKLSKRASPEIIEALVGIYADSSSEMKLLDAPPLDQVLKKLKSKNTGVKGLALEHLAIWMIRLLGLRFVGWRDKSKDTAGAEVDVTAENDNMLRRSKWIIQCKHQSGAVGPQVIAREVGLSIVSGADTIVMLTTSSFTADAYSYSKKVMEKYPIAIFMVDGNCLNRILKDKSRIAETLKAAMGPPSSDRVKLSSSDDKKTA